jgi:hypothetical protein
LLLNTKCTTACKPCQPSNRDQIETGTPNQGAYDVEEINRGIVTPTHAGLNPRAE